MIMYTQYSMQRGWTDVIGVVTTLQAGWDTHYFIRGKRFVLSPECTDREGGAHWATNSMVTEGATDAWSNATP
jgi:hypothetical protein